jgi:hypothetical protein
VSGYVWQVRFNGARHKAGTRNEAVRTGTRYVRRYLVCAGKYRYAQVRGMRKRLRSQRYVKVRGMYRYVRRYMVSTGMYRYVPVGMRNEAWSTKIRTSTEVSGMYRYVQVCMCFFC